MLAVCIKKANEGTGATEFLEVGKVYKILKEDTIGYYVQHGRRSGDNGWVVKECFSIEKYREETINKILDDTGLEM